MIHPISAGFSVNTSVEPPNHTGRWQNNPRFPPEQNTNILKARTFVRDKYAVFFYTLKWSYPMSPKISSQSSVARPSDDLLSEREQPASQPKPTILMVESDAPTLKMYHRVLNPEFEVIVRADKAGVMEVLSTIELQAIILEPTVGGGRGWNIFSAIQKALRERPVPVIVCSTLDERKHGLEMGASAYLVKPVSPGTLIETLHQIRRTDRNRT
jgi:PleD family two-component response regulator